MVEATPEESPGQTEASGEAQRTVHRQESASARDSESTSDVAPQSGQRADDEQTPPNDRDDDDQQLKAKGWVPKKPDRAAFWTMVATVALAIGTLGLAIATFDMARSTRSLVDLARQQSHDTQDALAVSRRQASAAEAANSLTAAPEISISATTFPAPTPNTKLVVSFGAFNIGRAPASEVQGQATLVVLPPPQLPQSLGECAVCEKTLLFPTQGFQGNGLSYNATLQPDRLTDVVVASIKNGTTFLYLMGRLDYLDADKKHHRILLCDVYKPEVSGGGPCVTGNEAD